MKPIASVSFLLKVFTQWLSKPMEKTNRKGKNEGKKSIFARMRFCSTFRAILRRWVSGIINEKTDLRSFRLFQNQDPQNKLQTESLKTSPTLFSKPRKKVRVKTSADPYFNVDQGCKWRYSEFRFQKLKFFLNIHMPQNCPKSSGNLHFLALKISFLKFLLYISSFISWIRIKAKILESR